MRKLHDDDNYMRNLCPHLSEEEIRKAEERLYRLAGLLYRMMVREELGKRNKSWKDQPPQKG